ncbi:MAG: ABC transporter transmembrane domain-containing protein, partial [bacterium]|nr:ABC transporter transmembrane domain-containing protein [bacterium]
MVGNVTQLLSLFRQAFGRYKLQIIALCGFGFLAGLLEGVGVNALIPLFSFASGENQGATDFISKQIANFFALFGLSLSVRVLLVFIAVLFGAKAVLTLFLNYLKLKIITDYEEEMRRSLFEKMLVSNWMHLMRQKLGHLETILTVDVPNAATVLGQMGGAITVVTSLFIYVFIALNISAPITLLTLGLGAVIFFVFQPFLKKIKILATERNQVLKETAHHVSENILGMKTIKAMRVEEPVAKKGRALFGKLRHSTLQVPFLKSIMSSLTEPVAVIFVSFIFA